MKQRQKHLPTYPTSTLSGVSPSSCPALPVVGLFFTLGPSPLLLFPKCTFPRSRQPGWGAQLCLRWGGCNFAVVTAQVTVNKAVRCALHGPVVAKRVKALAMNFGCLLLAKKQPDKKWMPQCPEYTGLQCWDSALLSTIENKILYRTGLHRAPKKKQCSPSYSVRQQMLKPEAEIISECLCRNPGIG